MMQVLQKKSYMHSLKTMELSGFTHAVFLTDDVHVVYIYIRHKVRIGTIPKLSCAK